MRHLVLLAVFASACDQGATAAPPPPPPVQPRPPLVVAPPASPPTYARYTVRDDADFAAKAIAVLDDLGAIFADGTKDCELIATRIEGFGAQNATRFGVLTAYGQAHPDAEKLLQTQFKPQTDKLIQLMMPAVEQCASNKRMMGAFQKLSESAQNLQQRPR